MKAKRTFITEQFLAKVRTTGSLAEAMERMKAHGVVKYEPLPKMTTWGLICEEIVDTEHHQEHYERCVTELRRRGLTDEKIHEMRDFAWRTAGWFNFEKMVWDWCALDVRLIDPKERDDDRSIYPNGNSRNHKHVHHSGKHRSASAPVACKDIPCNYCFRSCLTKTHRSRC